MKHTPGPWKTVEALDRHYKPCGYSVWQDLERPHLDSPIGNKICQTPDGTTQQAKANASLIAAAPDLLATLKLANEMLNHLYKITDDDSPDNIDHGKVRLAIAKAEGE